MDRAGARDEGEGRGVRRHRGGGLPGAEHNAVSRGTVVLVFTGGERMPLSVAERLPREATVVAAASGVDHALALGRHVEVAVGDFDSVSPAGLARVRAEGAEVERHPAAKDKTDLELALDVATGLAPSRVIVVG